MKASATIQTQTSYNDFNLPTTTTPNLFLIHLYISMTSQKYVNASQEEEGEISI